MAVMITDRAAKKPRAGFTLVELCVALAIIGLLVVLGFPVFSEGQIGAKRNVCRDRQHMVFEAALIYCADNVVPDGNLNVSVLQPNILQATGADCPAQQDGSANDYSIVIVDNGPTDVICDIHGDRHPWEPN